MAFFLFVSFIIQDLKFCQNCSAFYCVNVSGQRKSERIQRIIFTEKFSLMSGSCHLDRASNVETGVECQIFVIVIFFNCY